MSISLKYFKLILVILTLFLSYEFNWRNNVYCSSRIGFRVKQVFVDTFENNNSLIPNILQGIHSNPPPLIIKDSIGNEYLMVLSKYPQFYSKKTWIKYQSSIKIQFDDLQPGSASNYLPYPYFPFVFENQLIWFSQTNNIIEYSRYELVNNKDGDLNFKKNSSFFIEKKLKKNNSRDIFNTVSAQVYGKNLYVSCNNSVLSIDLETNQQKWLITIPFEDRGPFKIINKNLLLIEEHITDENYKLKEIFLNGISPIDGSILWRKPIKSQIQGFIAVNCSFTGNSLTSIENNSESNSCILFDRRHNIILIDETGNEILTIFNPEPYGEMSVKNPFSSNDYPFFDNSLFFTTYSQDGNANLKIVNFVTQEIRSISKIRDENKKSEWKMPVLFNLKNTPILLEEIDYQKFDLTKKDNQCFLYFPNIYVENNVCIYLSQSYKLPEYSFSNPISIGDNQIAFVTDKSIRIFEVKIE